MSLYFSLYINKGRHRVQLKLIEAIPSTVIKVWHKHRMCLRYSRDVSRTWFPENCVQVVETQVGTAGFWDVSLTQNCAHVSKLVRQHYLSLHIIGRIDLWSNYRMLRAKIVFDWFNKHATEICILLEQQRP